MKIFLFRISLLLLFVFLQISFFTILFPWFRSPLFLLGVVVAFSVVKPFPQTLLMTVPLTLLFDTVTLGALSWLTLYAVILAYLTSFLLRRLLLEHRGLGLGVYALVAFGAALLYQAFYSAFVYRQMASEVGGVLHAAPALESLLFSLASFLPVFVVSYFMVKRFEAYVDGINQKQFRNVR